MPAIDSPSTELKSTPASFRLKGGLFPLTLLELQHFDRAQWRQDLEAKVAEAPGFFQQTPVIVSLEHFVGSQNDIGLNELREDLSSHGMIAVALKGANEQLQAEARNAGLALMSANGRSPKPASPSSAEKGGGTQTSAVPEVESAPEIKIEAEPALKAAGLTPSKIITTPIRSGQQVYAPGGDLIVLANVSAGAEILADGNIHVYGPLRGRALAGVQGNTEAQVFCQSLEAELISIAGHFKLVEDLKNNHWKQAVRLSLKEQTLCIDALVK